MTLFRLCETRGAGFDKVVEEVEMWGLPAPEINVLPDGTRLVLRAHKPLSKMNQSERLLACYLHACLRLVKGEFLTNSSLRERFGIDKKNNALISRLIGEARKKGWIAPDDENAPKKLMRYKPFWD